MKTLSKRSARKYQHLELHTEREDLGKIPRLRPVVDAGAKGGRPKMGRLNPAELTPVTKGVSGYATYTNSEGIVVDHDVRGLPERTHKDRQIDKAKQKEAVQFRYAILVHKTGVYMRPIDKAVLLRMCEAIVVEQVPVSRLSDVNPYDNTDYFDRWELWVELVSNVMIKQSNN